MELKTNYQYTYFIHPFIIKEGKYQKYIQKMLKDKNFELKSISKRKRPKNVPILFTKKLENSYFQALG